MQSFERIDGGLLMFVVGTDVGMMKFVADLFSTGYNIQMSRIGKDVSAAIGSTHPDIMVVENMSVRPDAIGLVSSLKADRLTAHIPVILLNSFRREEDRIRSVESGADICITLPFDVRYLKAWLPSCCRECALCRIIGSRGSGHTDSQAEESFAGRTRSSSTCCPG